MKAAIYARYSTDMQSENSIEDQARNCRRYAEHSGLNVVANFEDKAKSGSSKNRPGFKAMLAAAERKEFDVLLVDDLSRLSRSRTETTMVIERFKFRRQRVVGVSEGYDSAIKGEKLQSTMRGLMNEIYIDDLREKTHRGLYGKALKGYSAGGRTYGYKRAPIENLSKLDVNGRPEIVAVEREINETEAKWVRRMFEWFAAGHSAKWIAQELNRLKVPSSRGSTWATSAIYGDKSQGNGLLNNQLYIGRYIWNRSVWEKNPDTGRRKRHDRRESEWVITEKPELRIVPQEIWDAVQARHKEIREKSAALRAALSNPKSRSHSGKYLFSGLLVCGCCGANFTMYSTSSFACAKNINRGKSVCSNGLRAPRRIVEERLSEVICKDLLSEESIEDFVRETSRYLAEKQTEQQPDYKDIKRDLDRAEREIANIMTAIKAGIITPSTKTELEKAEAERQHHADALLAATGPAQQLATVLPQAVEHYRRLATNLRAALRNDMVQAREYLKTLLGHVRLLPTPQGYLCAELRHNAEGLIKMALAPTLIVARVAGVGFEPTTFRL